MTESPEKSGRSQRSLKGFLIRPREQVKFSLVLVALSLMFLSLLAAGLFYSLTSAVNEMAAAHPEAAQYMWSSIASAIRSMVLLSLVLAIFSLAMGVILSHRIYGPLVPLLRQIERLKAGDFSGRVKLRESDELQEIAIGLNELAEALEKKK